MLLRDCVEGAPPRWSSLLEGPRGAYSTENRHILVKGTAGKKPPNEQAAFTSVWQCRVVGWEGQAEFG